MMDQTWSSPHHNQPLQEAEQGACALGVWDPHYHVTVHQGPQDSCPRKSPIVIQVPV